MADTTIQKCIHCGVETDCIEGVCQSCAILPYSGPIMLNSITEHPGVQRLISQMIGRESRIIDLTTQNAKLKVRIAQLEQLLTTPEKGE